MRYATSVQERSQSPGWCSDPLNHKLVGPIGLFPSFSCDFKLVRTDRACDFILGDSRSPNGYNPDDVVLISSQSGNNTGI
jgi:hypothetical protein